MAADVGESEVRVFVARAVRAAFDPDARLVNERRVAREYIDIDTSLLIIPELAP